MVLPEETSDANERRRTTQALSICGDGDGHTIAVVSTVANHATTHGHHGRGPKRATTHTHTLSRGLHLGPGLGGEGALQFLQERKRVSRRVPASS